MKNAPVFAFTRRPGNAPELPPPTPAAVAAEIAQTAEHVAAETALAELRDRREALKAEAEATVIRRDATGGHSRRDGISLAAFQRDRLAVEAEITAARRAIEPMRQEHGRRVAEALAERSAAAAAAGLQALAVLHAAADELAAVASAVNRAAHTAGAYHPAVCPLPACRTSAASRPRYAAY